MLLSPVLIDVLRPVTPTGRHPAKATVGEATPVAAEIVKDGHDELGGAVRLVGPSGDGAWRRLEPRGLGRYEGSVTPIEVGCNRLVVHAWTDRYASWRRDIVKWVAAGQDVEVELEIGARHLDHLAARATDPVVRQRLVSATVGLRDQDAPVDHRLSAGLDDAVVVAADAVIPEWDLSEVAVEVWVDRPLAACSAWYELFPRSYGGFTGVVEQLPRVERLGFDIVYLPPIHPIGRTHRKGRNNTLHAEPGDVGSPWAIGGPEGGHDAIHPELGSEDDFVALLRAARRRGMEVALDYALQCSPDHPWVREHPEWFTVLPDGSIRHAENPPKKYQDIYPINFWPDDPADRQALWQACRDVLVHWIELGVRVFRVDNPHTKPFAFWEWMIGSLRREYPDVIYLAEAFTDPPRMLSLAELGFTQSYTYFTWRHTKAELTEYLTELTTPPVVDTMRPNFWPNTPDILEGVLRDGALTAFALRFVLAATLTPNYGMFSGYELGENAPASPDNTEYLDSEKYQIVERDFESEPNLNALITRVNELRRSHPALRQLATLRFHDTDNDQLLAYSKSAPDPSGGTDVVLVVVNLDPWWPQAGFLSLDLDVLGVAADRPFDAHDELGGETFTWEGHQPWVRLEPGGHPAHILRIRPS